MIEESWFRDLCRGVEARMNAEILDYFRDMAEEFGHERTMTLMGQVPCPRPHVNLFYPGSRCKCGAQV